MARYILFEGDHYDPNFAATCVEALTDDGAKALAWLAGDPGHDRDRSVYDALRMEAYTSASEMEQASGDATIADKVWILVTQDSESYSLPLAVWIRKPSPDMLKLAVPGRLNDRLADELHDTGEVELPMHSSRLELHEYDFEY